MTKAKALRKYFKEAYGLDLEGMSAVEVLRAFFSENGIDSKGSTISAVLDDAVAAGYEPSGGGSCDAVIVDVLPEVGEEGKVYLLRNYPSYYLTEHDSETGAPKWYMTMRSFIFENESDLPSADIEYVYNQIAVVGNKLFSHDGNAWQDITEYFVGTGSGAPIEDAQDGSAYVRTDILSYLPFTYSNGWINNEYEVFKLQS